MAKDNKPDPNADRSLLDSLNIVAASLQLSIQSEEDVYRAFGEGVSGLGLRGGISMLDATGTSLTFRALGYSKKMRRAIAQLEKLTGLNAAGFSVKIEEVGVYREVINNRRTIFAENSREVVAQLLGKKLKRIVDKVANVFKDAPVIYSPLMVREKVLGIVNIAGPSLDRDDISAIEAFSFQLSIALDNARLFSALQASEETHRILVNTSPDSVTMTDLNGIITFASPPALALHGVDKPEEMIGKPALDLIAPEDREKAAANLQKTLTDDVIRDVEYTLVRADGTRFAGEMNAAVIRNAEGEPGAFIATTRDITERKRIEQLYRGLVDQALLGFVIVQDGRIVFSNEGFSSISGYSRDELLELPAEMTQKLVHPEDQEMVWGNLSKRLAGEDVVPRYTYRGISKDGSVRWLEMVASLADHDGRPAIQGAILDITDRVLAQEVVRESEEKLRDISTNVTDILYYHDLDGNFIEANLFYKQEMGYTEEDIRRLGVRGLIPDRYQHEYDEYIKTLVKNGRAKGLMRLNTKGGEERILEYRNSLVSDETGPIGVRGSARDITDRLMIERTLKESEERYRLFLTNFQGIAFRLSPDNIMHPTFLHGKVEEICGYSIDDFDSGKITWIGMLHPEDRRHVVLEMKNLRDAPDQSAQIECRIVPKDGGSKWIQVLIQIISEEDEPIGIHGAIYDVTERKKTEEELRISEERYRLFLRGFLGIAYRADFNFTPVFMHGSVEEITGYTQEKLISGKPTWDQVIHPDDLPGLFTEDEKKLHTVPNYSYEREYRIIRKDGEIRNVRDHIRNTCDASGEPTMLQGSIHDITEKVAAQEQLLISEERYRTLVENIRVGVYRTTGDGGGRFVHANPAMAEICGFDSADELMKGSVADLYQDPQERKAFLEEVLARGIVKDRELLLQRKDGTAFLASVNATATFNAQGDVEWIDGAIEDITERKKAEERLLRDAFYDELTGLPNRALLIDRLDRAIERSKRRDDYHCAVLFMDLDRFKVVNDSLGHAVGDKLLVSVAERLAESLRSGDTVARLGGDEFVVLLEELHDLNQATSIADRIRDELNTPHDLDGHKVFTSGSIGIVMTVQGYGKPADVLRDADIAMYGAKLAGKDRYQIFDPSMHELALTRMQLEVELRQALARDELRVHYQPILMMETGELFGFEALIRWEHPERGIIPPAEFLPILEETGLIIQAGRWVMLEACKNTMQWNKKHHSHAPFSISVNLSGREFNHPELEDYVKEALDESGLDPRCMTIEITEGVIMSDPEQARQVLERLGKLGVQIHLDDFGTGYSSLGKLGQFQIDKLKIDRTFIKQIAERRDEAAIVETILQLARNLTMGVIAEGVETKQQFDYLLENDCQFYQGYYIAKPMDKLDAEAFIKTKKRERKREKQH